MKIFNKSFYFWHPKNEFQRNFGTIEKVYCSKIQLYADNQYHIKNNLHSIAILTAFSTCKSIKKLLFQNSVGIRF